MLIHQYKKVSKNVGSLDNLFEFKLHFFLSWDSFYYCIYENYDVVAFKEFFKIFYEKLHVSTMRSFRHKENLGNLGFLSSILSYFIN